MIPPGSTIGILGGGQLGRMLAIAAAQLGYRCHIYAPEASGPATEVAAEWTQAGYFDAEAMNKFAASVAVVTYEFENIHPKAVASLAGMVPVHPSPRSLDVSGYRPSEKQCVQQLGGETAPYREVDGLAALDKAIGEVGLPAILKTTQFGYDGKGQARIHASEDAAGAWDTLSKTPAAWQTPAAAPAILEGMVDFIAEFSVILCRGEDGVSVVWDTPENIHKDGILDRSLVPARAEIIEQAPRAIEIARAVADQLGHVGILTLEFFATRDGPVFNEMAPRVHNSGHWTIEGSLTSQFENHIRAICGLPLGSTERVGTRVEMQNLIGPQADDWASILADPAAHLHLYGKGHSRPGRKMGHVTRLFFA